MKFCLGESEIDDSIHTIVSGPWDSCLECETLPPSSSSSSGECGACRVPQQTCGCWKTALNGQTAEFGVPKNWSFSVDSSMAICTAGKYYDLVSPCYIIQEYIKVSDACNSKSDCESQVVDSAPSISVSGSVQAWTSDGCDASGNPINPAWGGGSISLNISGACGGTTSATLPVTFGPSGINIDASGVEFTNCGNRRLTFMGMDAGSSWDVRYRREYDDNTLSEDQIVGLSFSDGYSVNLKLSASPTCRAPDTGQFCTCLDENYNLVGLGELPTYRADPGKCAGNPIDIDVICGVPSREDAGGNDPGMYTVYYSPYPNTVVVIGGVVYDTTKMPDPPPGKTNVLLVYVGGSRNDVREWTCKNLKYATIRDLSKWPGMGGSSTSSGGVIDVTNNLDFNWPYNDLYFSQGCPGGDSVNLVPC